MKELREKRTEEEWEDGGGSKERCRRERRKRGEKKKIFFFFKRETAYGIRLSLVGSEMCIKGRPWTVSGPGAGR